MKPSFGSASGTNYLKMARDSRSWILSVLIMYARTNVEQRERPSTDCTRTFPPWLSAS